MRWSLSLSSLTICVFLGLGLSSAIPLLPRREFELLPRIKGAEHLDDIPSKDYRETAKMTSIKINPDGTKTRFQNAEERKKDGEAKFATVDMEADHGLEKQQIPAFLKANRLPTFDSMNKATRERVNKVMNHVNNLAWVPKGLNASKKHAVGQAMKGKQVSTDYKGRTPYLASIYGRVKRAAKAVQKAILKDPRNKEIWAENGNNAQPFDRINRQHYNTMGVLSPGTSPATTPGHTPFSSRPPSTIGSTNGKSGTSPSGSSTSLNLPQAGGSTISLGKHSRSDSVGSASSDKASKKVKEGSPSRSSTPGSSKNKFVGLPKLNTNLMKSTPPSPKSPRSALRRPMSSSGQASKEGAKGRQQSPKPTSPRTPRPQANVRKTPTSPKSPGGSPKSPSRSPIRGGLASKPKVVMPKRAVRRAGKK